MSRHRDTGLIIQKIRRFVIGREYKPAIQFKANIQSQSQPHAIIPGPNYHSRHLAIPPKEVINAVHEGKKIEAKVGQSLMAAALAAGVQIEAACDGNCACSTCHVYIDERHIDKLEPPTEDEEDMLDLALFVQHNSRLSCQISITSDMDGIEFKLPSATRNFYAKRSKSED